MNKKEQDQPLVSVVMPAYNGERFIEEAIDSIINQTYPSWELIIVDDASVDKTVEIVKKYDDNRIRLFRNRENRGISYSTNFAISESCGEFIALLDDDDVATSDRLLLQVQYFQEHPDIDILGGRAVDIDANGNVIRHDMSAPLNNPRLIRAWMLFANRRFSNGTTMIRSNFLKENRLWFKEEYYGIQDFKFIADCSKIGNISSIDRILQLKRIHSMEATNIYIKNNYNSRKEKYAELQRESIIDSGFILSDDQFKIINDCLPEESLGSLNYNEIIRLIDVFEDMYDQAKRLNVDYIDELKIVFRNIVFENYLRKKDFFYISDLIKAYGK